MPASPLHRVVRRSSPDLAFSQYGLLHSLATHVRHSIYDRTNCSSQRESKGEMPKYRSERDAYSSTNTYSSTGGSISNPGVHVGAFAHHGCVREGVDTHSEAERLS